MKERDTAQDLANAINQWAPPRVREILLSGTDPDCKLLDEPLLHAALFEVIEGAPIDLVVAFTTLHADVNVTDPRGFHALDIAVGAGRKDLVDLLLEAGANPNLRSGEGELPLHCAVDRGNLDVGLSLLTHGATETMNDWSALSGLTPLGLAARSLHVMFVEMLCAHGASVAAKDEDDKIAYQRLPVRDPTNHDMWERISQLLK